MRITFTIHINRTARKVLLFALIVLVTAAAFFSFLPWLNRGQQAIQGLSIAGIDISKMPYEEAEPLIREKIDEYAVSDIAIRTEAGAVITTSPKTIGIDFDPDTTLKNAYAVGRQGRNYKKLAEQARALFAGIDKPVEISIDDELFNGFVNNSLSQIHKPAKNASFEYSTENDVFEFVPAENGRVIDVYELRTKLAKNAELLSETPVLLAQTVDEPLVLERGATEAKTRAEEILEGMPYLIITEDGDSWAVEKDDIVSWIAFVPVKYADGYQLEARISRDKIEEYLLQLAPGLHKEPVNAQFVMENGRVRAFNIEREGKTLDIEESAREIRKMVESGDEEANLVFNPIEPEITSKNIDNLGINALLGRGESNFAGSPNNRVHNIRVGSDKYQGILLARGEEFSFNRNLGPVNAAAGYLPELVILQDRTVPQYGGGLCQVSTTLYRAAIYAGLEITQRSPHSFHVQYYGTPGFDATIYPPNPDLRFRNNTPGHILVQYRIEGTRLIFEIYGQDDGRTVEVDGPHVYDRRADGSMKAWIKQTVYDKNDNIMEEKTFHSNYRSPALYPVIRNPFE